VIETTTSRDVASADAELVGRLRSGDEAAFAGVVDEHHVTMIRIASFYVRDRAAAEDVVQETWLAVVRGIDRFDGRSSFKTWLYRILTNRAKTAGVRQGRVTPARMDSDGRQGPAVDGSRFLPPDHPQWPGHWASPPDAWPRELDDCAVAQEFMDVVTAAIATLPHAQATVVTMRDVEGWTAKEVCTAMALTEANQRVLLHRARTRLREALESYHQETPT
jgi:RNA polymerase sigma-70 factor (ECF subfamily)